MQNAAISNLIDFEVKLSMEIDNMGYIPYNKGEE
jgi:hypothetical protein